MISFTEQGLNKLSLLEGALALNCVIEPDNDTEWVHAELERLAQEAEALLAMEVSAEVRLHGLLRLFYQEWGFKGDNLQYFPSDDLVIEKVLKRRIGVPLSLGAVFLFLAKRLSLSVKPIAFPTQLLIKIEWYHREVQYLNPFNGEFVTQRELHAWLIGKDGPLTKFDPSYLYVSDNVTLIGRWLAVLKTTLLHEENYTKALRCSELALTFSPDDPYEIRDRGYILQQLECDWVAAEDYEYFISQCPNDPSAELLKLQVKTLATGVPILH